MLVFLKALRLIRFAQALPLCLLYLTGDWEPSMEQNYCPRATLQRYCICSLLFLLLLFHICALVFVFVPTVSSRQSIHLSAKLRVVKPNPLQSSLVFVLSSAVASGIMYISAWATVPHIWRLMDVDFSANMNPNSPCPANQ